METGGWITLTIVLSVLATLLQIAGFAAPMWIWLDVDTFAVGVGFWYTTGCGLQGTCGGTEPSLSFGYSTADTWERAEFQAVRGLETVAVAGGVLLNLFLLVYRVGFGKWAGMGSLNMAAFLLAVLNWLCILAGLIVFCAYFWPVVGTSPLITPNSFPWSLLLCLLAALFFIVVCALVRTKCRNRYMEKHAIPVSGDAKMDLVPSTKHGLIHKYFSPVYNAAQGAIGIRSTSASTKALQRRLIGGEERRVAAIDNVAFNGGRVETDGANYRYLPTQNGAATRHAQGGVRRSLPTAVVSYTSTDATLHDRPRLADPPPGLAVGQDVYAQVSRRQGDVTISRQETDVTYQRTGGANVTREVTRQHRGGGRYFTAGTDQDVTHHTRAGGTRVTYQTNQDVTRRDTSYDTDGRTRDVTLQNGDIRRDVTLQNGDIRRDVSLQNGDIRRDVTLHNGDIRRNVTYEANQTAPPRDATGNVTQTTDEHVTHTTVTKPVVTTITTYVTQEERDVRITDRTTSQQEASNRGQLTRVHTSQTTQRQSSEAPDAWDEQSVKPYDPTYIYRPYSETC